MKPKQFWQQVLCEFLIVSLVVSPVWANTPPTLPISSVQVNVSGPMGLQINSFNGNLYYSRSELTIPGRGLSLAIDLAYNSAQSNLDGGFGFGWQFSYNIFYEQLGDDLLVSRGDGRVDLYLRDGGQFLRPLGVRDTLETFGSNGYVLTSPDGIKTFFESPAHRHVTRIQDPNGNTLIFSYSGTALTSIIDASGRQLTLTYENNRVRVIADPNATPTRRIRFQYDAAGNLTGLTDPLGHTTVYSYTFVAPYHLLTGLTDPLGHTATITYSGKAVDNIATAITSMSFDYSTETTTTMVTEVVEGRNQVSHYIYDASDRISSIQDGLGHTVTLVWDDRNRLLSYTDQNGHTTSYTYDRRDNVLTVTDPLGQVTKYTYDRTFDKVTRITDANGHTTRYEYDRKGNLIKIINALGKKTAFAYDAKGNPISITDAKNHTTTFSHNANGDLTRAVDPLGQTIRYRFDNVGSLRGVTDANGHTTEYRYDRNGNLTSITNPLRHETTFIYDVNGNLISRADPLGNSFTYIYDGLARLTQVADPLGHHTTYKHDQKGNLRTIVDGEGQTTTFEYDLANRLTSEIDPLSHTTSYGYDDAGNLTGKIDANGNQITYVYDELNRVRGVNYPGSNEASYSYDKVGNLTGMSNADVSVTYRYDAADQLTRVVTTVPGLPSKSVRYTYDNVGNRKTMTDPKGRVMTYRYDDANQLVRLINSARQRTSYSYDHADRLIRKDAHNGTAAIYTYDAADQLRKLTNRTSSGKLLSTFSYQYDRAGNRTRMTDAAGRRTKYDYDPLDQLTRVAYPGGPTVAYTYDAARNRETMSDADDHQITYIYDAANRLLSVGTTTTYAWDDNGNQIGKSGKEGITSYAYDAEKRLTDITLPGDAGTNQFTYYPDGRRLSATNAAGQTTYFFYDGLNVLAETNGSGATTARYTSKDVDDWISMERSGTTHYYHQDGLGSIVGLTDVSQAVGATYQYDAFGAITGETGSIVNPYRFTGREYDPESGRYSYRARYYDAEVGRFISQDLVRGSILLPATLHRYAYAVNNPVNLIDPLGQWPKFIKVIAAVVAGAVSGCLVGGVVGGLKGGKVGAAVGCVAVGVASAIASGAKTAKSGNVTITVETGIATVSLNPDPFKIFGQFRLGAKTAEAKTPPPQLDPGACRDGVCPPLRSNLVVQPEPAPAGGDIGNTGGIYATGGGGPGPTVPQPGKIIVNHDEWALSDEGFPPVRNTDAAQFALNVGNWFARGGPGNFLVYSTSFGNGQTTGLVGNVLSSTMTITGGHTWTIITTTTTFSLTDLLRYDGIFLAGVEGNNTDPPPVAPPPTQVLIDYVKAGGNVYVAGGTELSNPAGESEQWNPFLHTCGLEFEPTLNDIEGVLTFNSDHPIFAGVQRLYHNNGNSVRQVAPSEPNADAAILVSSADEGLYAVCSLGGPINVRTAITLSSFTAGAGPDRVMLPGKRTASWTTKTSTFGATRRRENTPRSNPV